MATTAQLKRRIDRLCPEQGFFTVEDFVLAQKYMLPDETQTEAMCRLWPNKLEHPWLLQKALESEAREPPENTGEIQ